MLFITLFNRLWCARDKYVKSYSNNKKYSIANRPVEEIKWNIKKKSKEGRKREDNNKNRKSIYNKTW